MEKANINQKKLSTIFRVFLLIIVLLMVTFRATGFSKFRGVICVNDWPTFTSPCVWRNVSIELLLWSLAVITLIVNLIIDSDFDRFYEKCKQNWLVFLFIILAFASLTWTIRFDVSFYKFSLLLFASLMAIYVGYAYSLDGILKILTLYYVFLCTLNLLFIVSFPALSIMEDPFFKGAWQGLFWHRNYLGIFMVPGIALFLLNLLASKKIRGGDFFLNLIMLLLTSFLLIKSKNATGIITAIGLVGLIVFFFFWTKFNRIIKPIHYYGFLVIMLAIGTLFFTKLDFFLGLLGRNTSLTGRVPMWEYLFQHIIIQRPWLGYGFGAIWHMEGFLEELRNAVNWGVGMGDNGYIDILLHLGAIGLIVLVAMIIIGFVRAIRYYLEDRSLIAIYPLLFIVFVVVSNISLSLILETEQFVWLIAIAVIASITRPKTPISIPARSQGLA